jgi:hypothetical protein
MRPASVIPTATPTSSPTHIATFTLEPTQTYTPSPSETPKPVDLPLCPGAKYSSRLQANRDAQVCTQFVRLTIRISTSLYADEIISLYPRTYIHLLEGPVCAESFWWWKVEVYAGTTYSLQAYPYEKTLITEQSIIGWAREGWDMENEYFICQ